MREIKFRGKRIDNGQWVYGMPYSFKQFVDFRKNDPLCILMFNPEWNLEAQFNYLKDPVHFAHLENSIWKVIPETVMQYIGLKDKNGKEIYEGDIIEFFNVFTKRLLRRAVEYCSEKAYFSSGGNPLYNTIQYIEDNREAELEVIGNTYENRELLKEK